MEIPLSHVTRIRFDTGRMSIMGIRYSQHKIVYRDENDKSKSVSFSVPVLSEEFDEFVALVRRNNTHLNS